MSSKKSRKKSKNKIKKVLTKRNKSDIMNIVDAIKYQHKCIIIGNLDN